MTPEEKPSSAERLRVAEGALEKAVKYFSAQDLPSHCVTLRETMDLRTVAKSACSKALARLRSGKDGGKKDG